MFSDILSEHLVEYLPLIFYLGVVLFKFVYNLVNFYPIFKIFFCLKVKAYENRQKFKTAGTHPVRLRPNYSIFENLEIVEGY